MFVDFRERKERERERNIHLLPSLRTLTGDPTCNLGRCPHRELNSKPFGVQNGLSDQPSHAARALLLLFSNTLFTFFK